MKRPTHNSMRGWFAAALYEQMLADHNIYLLTADLGFGMLDEIRRDFPQQFINFHASEQAMVGAAIGMALQGRKPFCYSITPFLLYRPFEWIRNYLHHEQIPVRLVGAGMDGDYQHDGFTHHAYDAKQVLACVPNVKVLLPEHKEQIPLMVDAMCADDAPPSFLALRR